MKRAARSLLLALAGVLPLTAGDAELLPRGGTLPGMVVPPAPALTPAQELESLRVDPAFRVELVASEPLVQDPVAMTWDADGRLWVVEMRGYMAHLDGEGEKAPVGRVSVLEDRDGDGVMDTATVFLDGLVQPRALALVPGGVLVAEPPHLWFCRDTDGDLRCDAKTEVAAYARSGPVEHCENGLLWTLDNWMYNANSERRFRFADGVLSEAPTRHRGQWGIAEDDYGRLYYNFNSTPLWVDLYPADYLGRNPHLSAKLGLGVALGSGGALQSARVNPGVNRGYQQGTLQADGRLASVTAVAGVAIYRGAAYPPAYLGNAFVPEPAANLVMRIAIERNGIELKGTRALVDAGKGAKREFLTSTDERFRPVNVASGPDGCLYVVDMYRGVIQHKAYITPYLRQQAQLRGLEQPIGLGRIWRLAPRDAGPPARHPTLTAAPAAELVRQLSDPDAWWRDTAQRLLVGRRDLAAIPALRALAHDARLAVSRLQALWTLDGLDACDVPTLLAAVTDADAAVRVTALQIAHRPFAAAGHAGLPAAITALSADPDQMVRINAMFCLGAGADDPEVRKAMRDLLTAQIKDRHVRQAAWSGLKDLEIDMLRELLADPRWQQDDPDRAAALRELAACAIGARDPAIIARLLDLAAAQPAGLVWAQAALLSAGGKGRDKDAEPIAVPAKPEALARLEQAPDAAVRALAAEFAKRLRIGAAATAPGAPLSAADQALIDRGRTLYAATCLACHQENGRGLPGIAPPLVGSPWALGAERRLVRIVLHGLGGPLTVHDEHFDLVMPAFADNPVADDAGIAAILSYVRHAWGNAAPPVRAETVRAIRDQVAGRREPWTVVELEHLK